DKFAFVPEFGLNVAFPVYERVSLTAAFNALYWSRIIRPRDQIDRVIDITQIPNFPVPPGTVPTGLQRPTVLFDQTHFGALGSHSGVEVPGWGAVPRFACGLPLGRRRNGGLPGPGGVASGRRRHGGVGVEPEVARAGGVAEPPRAPPRRDQPLQVRAPR